MKHTSLDYLCQRSNQNVKHGPNKNSAMRVSRTQLSSEMVRKVDTNQKKRKELRRR